MKILFISYFFPPYNVSGSIRTGKTAKILTELGHEVRVIAGIDKTSSPDLPVEIPENRVCYLHYFDFEGILLSVFKTDKNSLKSIAVNKENKGSILGTVLNKVIWYYKNIFYVPDKQVFWYFPAIKKAESIISSWMPDIIFASAIPYTSLLVASDLSKRYKIPFVAELRDLWTDNNNERYNYIINRFLENRTLNRASAIVTVSEPLVHQLKKRFKKPIYEIRNAFDKEDFMLLDDVEYSFQKNEKIIITYAGSIFIRKQDPSLLFQAIAECQTLRGSVVCKFYTDNIAYLTQLVSKFNIANNVEIYNKISRKDVLNVLKRSDVLLLLNWNDPDDKGVYSGKLFEYIGCAKPILVIGNNETVALDLINTYGFGCVGIDTKQIHDFLLSVKDSQFVKRITDNYAKYRYLFERRHQVQKLVNIFEDILAKKI